MGWAVISDKILPLFYIIYPSRSQNLYPLSSSTVEKTNLKVRKVIPSLPQGGKHFLGRKFVFPVGREWRELKFRNLEFGSNARFTFLPRQHETRREWECEGYIRLIFYTLNLFSFRLKALKISLKSRETRLYRMSCLVIDDTRTGVWMSTFMHTSFRSHLTKSLDEYPRQDCKPGIKAKLADSWELKADIFYIEAESQKQKF